MASLEGQNLAEIADYHNDVTDGLRLLYQGLVDSASGRFIGYSPAEVHSFLLDRLEETDIRSCLALLTALEAAFRTDYLDRVKKKRKDSLSLYFRSLYKHHAERASLEEDLLKGWVKHHPNFKSAICEFKGALKFRNWIAHGRYWQPKLGRKYDFPDLYILATGLLEALTTAKSDR